MKTVSAATRFLRDEFPEWIVIDEPREAAHVEGRAILAMPAEVRNLKIQGPETAVAVDVTIALLSGARKPSEIEDDLDSMLTEVIAALDRHPYLTWESAQRTALAEAGHCWQMTLTHIWQITTE